MAERVDRIEQERRDERQRALDRWVYAMLAVAWSAAIAMFVLAIVKHAN
ncbi:MAG: hypothetical protein JJE35_05245 [Thermoleophilia bacterium]|nr:hypothetical protein [Thermoleophilia bacterium]